MRPSYACVIALCWALSTPPAFAAAPVNDTVSGAQVLWLGVAARGTTVEANDDYRAGSCPTETPITSTTAAGRDVVYTFVAPAAGTYTVEVFSWTGDRVLYAASALPAAASAPAVVDCVKLANRRTSGAEQLTVTLAAGQQIYLFVDNHVADPGAPFRIAVSIPFSPDGADTIGTAAPFSCGVRQQIGPAGDVDFFSLGSYPADFRLFALLDTAAGTNSDGTTANLTLRATTATDTLEFDNNIDNGSSTNLAGTRLPGGPAYLRVAHASPTGAAGPYQLYAVVHPPSASATPEAEPNDSVEQAFTSGAMYYAGAISDTDKADYYRVFGYAGDVITVHLDLDPARDGSSTQASLQLFGPPDADPLSTIDDGVGYESIVASRWFDDALPVTVTTPSPGTLTALTPRAPGTAVVYRMPATGYATIRVGNVIGGGDYLLAIGRNCGVGAIPRFKGRPTLRQTFRNSTSQTINTGTPTVTSTLTVSGAGQWLTDVDVTTFLPHSFTSDLHVTLTSPAGTRVDLVKEAGGSSRDLLNGAVFDDQADPGREERVGTTRLTLPAPSVDGITEIRFEWRTPRTTGRVLRPDLELLTMTLYKGATLHYTDRIVADGRLQPFGGGPRLPGWNHESGLLKEVDTGGPTATPGSGVHYEIEAGYSGSTTVVITRYDNGVATAGATVLLAGNTTSESVVRSRQVGAPGSSETSASAPVLSRRALTTFRGENPNGMWTLEVTDVAPVSDNGRLDAWQLDVNTLPVAPLTQTQVFSGQGSRPIADQAAVRSTLTVPTPGREVIGLLVTTGITHPASADLTIDLRGPGGQQVQLVRGKGQSSSFALTNWYDRAGLLARDYDAATGAATNLAPFESLTNFSGLPSGGTWELLVRDTVTSNTGTLNSWSLSLITLVPCDVTLTQAPRQSAVGDTLTFTATVNDPTCAWSATSRVPWLTLTGAAGTGNGTFTGVVAPNLSAQARTEALRISTRNVPWDGLTGPDRAEYAFAIDVDQQGTVYTLAEGATGTTFDYDLLLANPTTSSAPYTIDFLRGDGQVVPVTGVLAPQSRATLRVDSVPGLDNAAMSAVVTSTNGVPLVVERTMIWDGTGYGGHTGRAIDVPSRTWYFAEGSQGFFDTYVLLANPNQAAVTARVTFLLEDDAPIEQVVTLPATSRTNVFAGLIPGLVGKGFSIRVDADEDILAERAMYFGTQRFGEGGHESPGVPAPATSWFLAEGATGPFFDTFVLVANPNAQAATITVNYLLASGTRLTRTYTVGANRRFTIWLDQEDPLMANTAVSTTVTSTQPVVVERAMYWPGSSATWFEAHNALGATAPALKWGLAEGRVGGDRAYSTFILLANPSTTTTAQVQVTFLREGGGTLVKTFTVPPTSRTNVWVNADAPELATGAAESRFGTLIEVTNGVPIAVERAMYWRAGTTDFAGGTTENATRVP